MTQNNQVARRYVGHFIDGDYREFIQLEYRYLPNGVWETFLLYTSIRGQEYRIEHLHFFGAVATLLDQLPQTSAIVLQHQVLITRNNRDEITTLEEWWRPYSQPDAETVVYQLRLRIGDTWVETPKTELNYPVVVFNDAARLLQKELGPDIRVKICIYCKFLVGYNVDGGTDNRHDQLYCMRDAPDELAQIMQQYPSQRGTENWIRAGLADVDAVHSCSAFTYTDADHL